MKLLINCRINSRYLQSACLSSGANTCQCQIFGHVQVTAPPLMFISEMSNTDPFVKIMLTEWQLLCLSHSNMAGEETEAEADKHPCLR